MANRRLTQRLIDTLKPGKSVREFRDTELRGFGVRILPSGRRRFFVHAQVNGKRTWTKIGDAGAMTLVEARDLARSHLATSRTGGPSRSSEIAAETPFENVADAVFRRQSRPAHGTHFPLYSLIRLRYRCAHGRPCFDSERAFLGGRHQEAVADSRAAGRLPGRDRPKGMRRLRLRRPSRATAGHELPFRASPP